MNNHDLDVIRAAVREELAPVLDRLTALASIHDRLNTIEQKLGLIPDLNFFHSSEFAQQVLAALRKAEAKPPEPHVGLTVPPRGSWQAATARQPRRGRRGGASSPPARDSP